MKILVVYDSYFGNTKKIAQCIAETLFDGNDVRLCRAGEVGPGDLTGVGLLVVGSPTRAFSPVVSIKHFLRSMDARQLKGVKIAAFDTRIALDSIRSKVLRKLVGTLGYAAEPVSRKLIRKGGEAAADPAGFVVTDSEGPLKQGEIQRAAEWAEGIRNSV